MTNLERALGALLRFLEERRIPYMIIGGIANLIWGEPRATLDVDAVVLVEDDAWPDLIKDLREEFRLLPRDPLAFLKELHVLPIETHDGTRIDLIWATLPYEHKAIARAIMEEVAGHRARVCRPDDLIIYKILSERSKDREDVRAIVRHQRTRLDRRYLTRTLRAIERTLGRSDLVPLLATYLRQARAPSAKQRRR